jgi:hypothetical protein
MKIDACDAALIREAEVSDKSSVVTCVEHVNSNLNSLSQGSAAAYTMLDFAELYSETTNLDLTIIAADKSDSAIGIVTA